MSPRRARAPRPRRKGGPRPSTHARLCGRAWTAQTSGGHLSWAEYSWPLPAPRPAQLRHLRQRQRDLRQRQHALVDEVAWLPPVGEFGLIVAQPRVAEEEAHAL